jgi:hypothetical protein
VSLETLGRRRHPSARESGHDLTVPVEDLIDELAVGAVFGAWHGGGRLLVRHGAVTLRPSRVLVVPDSATGITQESGNLLMYCPRIAVPWLNTYAMVAGRHAAGRAGVPSWMRRRLRRGLAETELHVIERQTWLFTGKRLLNPL